MSRFVQPFRLALAACLALMLSQPTAAQTAPSAADPSVRTTVVAGVPAQPAVRAVSAERRGGEVSLNLQGVDVASAAKAVLGDLLHLQYTLPAQTAGTLTVATPRPVRRTEVLALFEDALRTAGYGLSRRAGGAYAIEPLADARSQAEIVAGDQAGYGNETITLKFVGAEQIRRVIDPMAPGAIASADAASNTLVVSGTARQRKAMRDLVGQFDVNWLRGMSFALFVPERTDSRLIVPELEKLINGEGAPTAGLVRLIAMDRLNGILAITAQPQYLEDVRRWVEVLDREGESAERRVFVYPVQNGRASDLAATVIRAFGGTSATTRAPTAATGTSTPPATPADTASTSVAAGDSGSPSSGGSINGGAQTPSTPTAGGATGGAIITSNDANNAVVVYGSPREYAVVEDALRKLDIAPVQVLIEAAITEVTLTDNLRYGVQWQLGHGSNIGSLSQGTTGAPVSIFPGFSYVYNNGRDIQATLNALAQLTRINVVSAPKLVVMNNQTAVLQVGDEVPIVTASAVGTQTPDSPIVNSVEYRDTGVILKVTPRVNGGGSVLLDISQEVSDVSTTDTSKINSPTIQQRKIATSVIAQDGQTIALGGMIRDTRTTTRDGLPVISRIPLLGALFGNHDSQFKRTELLVLLTIHVVKTPVDAEAITDELRRKIQTFEPPPAPDAYRRN